MNDKDLKLLNFNEILELFNSAISQEQAWAVLYQLLKEFKSLIQNNLNATLTCLNNFNLIQFDLSNVYFRSDGSLYLNLFLNGQQLFQPQPQQPQSHEHEHEQQAQNIHADENCTYTGNN
jgi:hypothetical protein